MQRKVKTDVGLNTSMLFVFKCGRPGHKSPDCNLRKASPIGAVKAGSVSSPVIINQQAKCKKPVVLWKEEEERRPVTDGIVNGIPVKVLRDTGSSVVVVKSTLASKRTGQYRWLKTINSTMLKVSTAMVQIDSPYFVGEVEAS